MWEFQNVKIFFFPLFIFIYKYVIIHFFIGQFLDEQKCQNCPSHKTDGLSFVWIVEIIYLAGTYSIHVSLLAHIPDGMHDNSTLVMKYVSETKGLFSSVTKILKLLNNGCNNMEDHEICLYLYSGHSIVNFILQV